MEAMTLRLDGDLAEELEIVASVDGVAVTEVVRAAIQEHIDARKRDHLFREKLRTRIERTKQMLG
ncbi:hypothetical protein AB0425_17510 [Actinosynnema sp. NPDC051121]